MDKLKEIAIASDHAGYQMKENIKIYLSKFFDKIIDFGTNSPESVDYPDYIHPLSKAVDEGKYKMAIILCSSGNGACITANKYKNVRAVLCWTKEISFYGRAHNDANILGIPAKYIDDDTAYSIVDTFLNTEFEGGRHQNRVNKISNCL